MFGFLSPETTSNAYDQRQTGGDFATLVGAGQYVSNGLTTTKLLLLAVVAIAVGVVAWLVLGGKDEN